MSGPLFNTWAFLPNIATLRSLGGLTLCDQAADVVNLTGYYSPSVTSTPDGGGGTFVYDATDTTTADDGGMVIVDTAGRRWKRQYSGLKINVMWFGAVADANNLPGGGTDNAVAFQNCLDFCLAFGGGFISGRPTIYVPAGMYRVANTLTQNGLVNWEGEGKSFAAFDVGSFLIFDHANDDCVTFAVAQTYVTGWTVRNISFKGINQSVLQDCFHFISGDLAAQCGFESVGFYNFTGACLHWPPGSTSYFQAVYFNKITTSIVGCFNKVDPAIALTGTMWTMREFDQENGTNQTIATQHQFFDFRSVREVHINQIIVEGGALNPSIFTLGGNAWYEIDGLHVENGPPANVFEFVTGGYPFSYGGSTSFFRNLSAVVTDALVKFNTGTKFNSVVIESVSVGSPNLGFASLVNDQGENNDVFINEWTATGGIILPDNLLTNLDFKNVNLIQITPLTALHTDLVQDVFISEHGQWLDGLSAGCVILQVDPATVTDIGMFTDANEGRVFELVSVAATIPDLKFIPTAPTSLVGQQITIAIRYYVDTADANLSLIPLLPGGANAPSKKIYTGDLSTTPPAIPDPYLPLNVWNNAYCIFQPPNTTATLVATGQVPTAPAPVGVTKYRISAVFIGTGRGFSMPMSGGSLKPMTWTAAAAPSYGDYLVGDTVWNVTPVVGQPVGWKCTVAGSPGTWVAMANL